MGAQGLDEYSKQASEIRPYPPQLPLEHCAGKFMVANGSGFPDASKCRIAWQLDRKMKCAFNSKLAFSYCEKEGPKRSWT